MKIISVFILELILALSFPLKAHCSSIELSLTFDVNDFSFVSKVDDYVFIESTKGDVNYSRDIAVPCLPFIKYSLVIHRNQCLSSIKIKSDQSQIIMNDVILCDTPNYIPTSESTKPLSYQKTYPDGNYPVNAIKDIWNGNVGGYNIVSFSVCPFEYNVVTRELIFKTNIEISIDLEQSNSSINSVPLSNDNDFEKLLRSVVLNPEELDESYPKSSIQKSIVEEDDLYDYVIITSESLKNAFEPLVEWKRIKGLNCLIVTTEEIKKHYTATSKELKIKKCILDLSFNNGVKYVLLGGDIDIIPAVYCYCSIPGYNNRNAERTYTADFDDLPADLYYGTPNGDIDWDGNKNGIRGELDDRIDLTPYIYVTRLPVNDEEEVKCVIDKILFYEQTPDYNGWQNRIFMSGCKLSANYYTNGRYYSDGEMQSQMLYDNVFKNLWDGRRFRYFDTFIDLSLTPPNKLDATIINEHLSQGYAFFDMVSHGSFNCWATDEDSGTATFYTGTNAKELECSQPTLITTIACHTNRFDSNRKSNSKIVGPSTNHALCLSESFLLNNKCNVFAYFGSSREGWSNPASDNYGFGPSNEYISKFYQLLFDPSQTNKSFGALVNLAKASKIIDSQSYDTYRWLQFTLNPLGDPEMQIYPSAPKHFQNGIISINNNTLSISVTESDCKFCLYEFSENGLRNSHVKTQRNSVYFNLSTGEGIICLTKIGYTPFFVYFKDNALYLQNDMICQNWIINCDSINIGKNVTTNKKSGIFKVLDGEINLNAKNVVLEAGTYIASGVKLNIKTN